MLKIQNSETELKQITQPILAELQQRSLPMTLIIQKILHRRENKMALTAKQLKELIALIPDDTPIVMQKDDEGNGYRLMTGIEFIPFNEDRANFFCENESEVFRKEHLVDYDRSPSDPDLVLCAVTY